MMEICGGEHAPIRRAPMLSREKFLAEHPEVILIPDPPLYQPHNRGGIRGDRHSEEYAAGSQDAQGLSKRQQTVFPRGQMVERAVQQYRVDARIGQRYPSRVPELTRE